MRGLRIPKVKTHDLKSWPQFFRAIADGTKTHELRINDREFEVGDVLLLREYDPKKRRYTGRQLKAHITYITSQTNSCAASPVALRSEYCILSIRIDPEHT